MTEYKLPLRNRKGEILDYCLVSHEDYCFLSKFNYYKNKDGYAQGNINKKLWLVHRYIMINILNHEIESSVHVDHINSNPLDNRRENLRIATAHGNSRNRKKVENRTSKYHYVSYSKSRQKWMANIKHNGKYLSANYLDEIHAAHQVNLWIEEYNIPFAKKNNIEPPDNFVLYKSNHTKSELPQGVYFVNNKYRVKFTHNKQFYELGEFNTLDEAVECRTQFFKKVEEEKEAEIMSGPITRDTEGNCLLQIKKKNEIINLIVDEDIYHNLIRFTWCIVSKNYIAARIDGNMVRLSRYIMNYDGKDIIDHINGNIFDNRRCNLRVVTPQQNSMNRSSSPNTSSKYIGVSLNKNTNKWHSNIKINGKMIYLGRFDNEEDAARERDTATKKYFGEYGKLNFPEE
jgi:hypothetical protein